MFIDRRLSFAAAIALALTVMAGAPYAGLAQTQARAATDAPSDNTSITVFSHRQHSAATARSDIAAEHPAEACVVTPQKYKRSTFISKFGQASDESGTEQAFGLTGAQDLGIAILGSLDPCGANGRMFANPRMQVLANDKSLDEAFKAYDAGKYAEAMPLFKTAYDKAQYDMAGLMLGRMYLLGQGTEPDVAKAIIWFKKVAEIARDVTPNADHPDATITQRFDPANPNYMSTKTEAAMFLARIYEVGYKVPKDPVQARKWYMVADTFGFVPATHAVGEMFLNGYGGEQNTAKAIAYFKRAGGKGYAPSQYALGEIYYFGDAGVAQDKTTAGAWLLAAAKAGYPDALYSVGRMYELGEGGAKADLPKAMIYYKEAAIKGQVDAEVTLATYLYTGEGGVPKDLDTARKLFEAAAEAGDQDAMFNLAVMMVNGEGGPKDLVHAYCWFYIADKGGVATAKAAMQELSGKMTPDERAQAEALLNPPKPAAK
jgi:TPR repeat protein